LKENNASKFFEGCRWSLRHFHFIKELVSTYTRRKLVHYNRSFATWPLQLMLGKCIKISLWLSTRRFWIMTN
jgi:hypothetical protein